MVTPETMTKVGNLTKLQIKSILAGSPMLDDLLTINAEVERQMQMMCDELTRDYFDGKKGWNDIDARDAAWKELRELFEAPPGKIDLFNLLKITVFLIAGTHAEKP